MELDNQQLEYSIVGACCIDQRILDKIGAFLKPEDFFIKACADVYEAALDANFRGKLFDPVIAADALRGLVDEPEKFVTGCMDVTPTCANAEYHANLLHTRAEARRFREETMAALDSLDDTDKAAEVAGICQRYLAGRSGKHLHTYAEALAEACEGIADGKGVRIDTEFPRLDGILKGLCGGNLILIGARPGVGKSAFALDIAESAARHGYPVLIFSMEMLADEVAERAIARNTQNVALDSLIDKHLEPDEWQRVTDSCNRLSRLPIRICDKPNVNSSYIRSTARAMPDLRLLIVDYAGLMQSSGKYDSRNLELGAISRELKNLATELKIPVIALCQLNRAMDDTEQPKLSSLRDSGELEQNANKIIFLWNQDKDSGTVGVAVAKNRRGKTGSVQMRFDGSHMRYIELSQDISFTAPKRKRKTIYGEDED